MSPPLLQEVVLRASEQRQAALPLTTEGVARWLRESRYGSILIEVIGADVYVNGQRVVPDSRASDPDGPRVSED